MIKDVKNSQIDSDQIKILIENNQCYAAGDQLIF